MENNRSRHSGLWRKCIWTSFFSCNLTWDTYYASTTLRGVAKSIIRYMSLVNHRLQTPISASPSYAAREMPPLQLPFSSRCPHKAGPFNCTSLIVKFRALAIFRTTCHSMPLYVSVTINPCEPTTQYRGSLLQVKEINSNFIVKLSSFLNIA